jgi:DNA end-binding protein Ku
MALVEKKVKAGDTEAVIEPAEEAPAKSADIIDLTELLQRSLRGGAAGKSKAGGATERRAPAKAKKGTGGTTVAARRKHAA